MITDISPASLDTVIWRRGCIGTCDFCRVAEINKGKVRLRSIASVAKEMKLRHDFFKVKNFYIVDANFTSNKTAVMDFCKTIKKELPGVSWRTESRFDTLDEALIAEMKQAGCTHIKLGLENALHEKHQVKTKKVALKTARDWIARIQKHGIKCIIYLMLGGKWFTPSQYREMYRNAESLNADGYTVSFFNPYPSTPAGISFEEWDKRKFTGSHLDIRLVDFWKIPTDIVEAFFTLELKKGREDKSVRSFIR
jgi:anaerobic magnesium-protoporphyrin IX monomethyl ester cyclase